MTPEFAGKTVVNVRSVYDPVVLFDEDNIEETSRELEVSGIIIMVFSALLAVAVVSYLIGTCRKPKDTKL